MYVLWTETLKELFDIQSERFYRSNVDTLMVLVGWIGGDPVEATSFSTECLLSDNEKTLVRQVVVAALRRWP